MPQPPSYTIATDFSADESNAVSGRSTVTTAGLDTELINIKAFIDQMRTNIALAQADDGTPKDQWIDLASLSDTVTNWITTNGNGWYSPDVGSVNQIAVTLNPPATALSNGMFVVSDIKLTNTSSTVTLNVNGLGAKSVVTDGAGTTPTIGLLTIGTFYGFQYDSSQDKFQIVFSGDSISHASTCITKAAEASASATDANSAKVAAEGYLDTFTDQYLGAFATLPAVDLDGDALTDGDLAYNTTLDVMFVYDLGTTAWIRLKPTTSEQTAINGVNAVASDVQTVSGVSSAVSNVSGISANVTTCANNNANITTTAQNISGINSFGERYRVGTSDPVSDNDSGDLFFNTSTGELRAYSNAWQATAPSNDNQNNINIIAGEIVHAEDNGLITDALTEGSGNGDISAVASNISSITSVAGSTANIALVGGSIANVNLTGGSIANVNLTGGSIASVNAVSSSIANVNAVASDATDIGVVAGKETEIGLLGTSANVTAMSTLSTHVTNIDTCATSIASINTTAGDTTAIGVVAGLSATLTAVNGNSTNINSVNSNSTNINLVAGGIADVNRYADEYSISGSAPGSPSSGDLWYDSSANSLKYRNASEWVAIAPGITAVADDTSPQLAGALDCQNNNLSNVGTIDGTNLSLDFGTL